jgi:hypothetical protein
MHNFKVLHVRRRERFIYFCREKEKKEREISFIFKYLFYFFLVGSGAHPVAPGIGGGGWRRSLLRLLNSGQGNGRAAITLPVDEDAAVRFQDQLITLDLQMRGNPYEQSRRETGDGWQLRDRARWGVSHIQFDKHPPELLRLRHVHRGCSCRRNIVVVL